MKFIEMFQTLTKAWPQEFSILTNNFAQLLTESSDTKR